MDTNKIAEQLSELLPDRPNLTPMIGTDDKTRLVKQEAAKIKANSEAKELARIKYKEKQKLKQLKAKELKDEAHKAKIKEQEDKIKVLEEIEAQAVEPLSATELSKKNCKANVNQLLRLQGTSRPEIAKLLTSLNINMSIQLTKHDTANLLACLLTCNETQLEALYSNKKIPLAIKTVIRRLQDDAKFGNIDTIERLWDRVFGKGQMMLDLPEQQQLQTGIIPNVPVSREAYIVIRDTLIK